MASSLTAQKPRTAWPLAWQGWRLDLPPRWDPAKLDGSFDAGMILLADLEKARLGVRWRKLGKKIDIKASVRRAMLDEVGKLATEEATFVNPPGDWEHGLLYVDPKPPGRDVWVGFSRSTGRLFQLVYHAQSRDRVLSDTLVPRLRDDSAGDWAIFDLSLRTPGDAVLTKTTLNVGDLRLDFAVGREIVVARQVAVASMAIARQPIEKWLFTHQKPRHRHYRPTVKIEPVEWTINDQRLAGVQRVLTRRRRFFFLYKRPRQIVAAALKDEVRDRLLIIEAASEELVKQVIGSIGWARDEASQQSS